MAERFPLIIDTNPENNALRELPFGDDLTLKDNSIASVNDINAKGTISSTTVVINGNTVKDVAWTANYNDLQNKPDLIGKTTDLNDVENTEANNNQILVYNSSTEKFVPRDLDGGSA